MQFCLIVVVVAVHVLPTVDGWTLSVAVSGLPVRLKRYGNASLVSLLGSHFCLQFLAYARHKSRCLPSRAASQEQRGGLVNLAAQVNPVEKFATNIRDAVAGTVIIHIGLLVLNILASVVSVAVAMKPLFTHC